MLLGKGGLFGNVFRLAPPMLISQEDLSTDWTCLRSRLLLLERVERTPQETIQE